MIVSSKNKNTTSGNNALSPQYTPTPHIEKQKHRDLEKLKKEYIKINKEKAIIKKAKTLRNIAILFAIGITLVYRYSLIYNLEKEIIDVKKQIASVNAESESLRISLLKYNNIEYLEENAISKLNMIPKSKTGVIYIDLDKNNFKNISEEEKKENSGFINRLKKILY